MDDDAKRPTDFDPFADDWKTAEPEPATVETEPSGEPARAEPVPRPAAERGSPREAAAEDESPQRSAAEREPPPEERPAPRVRPARTGGAGVVASWQARINTPEQARGAIEELLEHRRERRGRVIGLAGLPGHGKSDFARRLRIKSVERPGVDLRYDKTETGEVNIYYVPGRHEHHALIDMAGEDFKNLGSYDEPVPGLMREFLWPVLQELDGLILMMALPIVWQHYNAVEQADRVPVSAELAQRTRQAQDAMLDAHRMLLKYAAVAQDLKRLGRRFPDLSRDHAPDRELVDDAFKAARPLRAPVVLAFSKADLYQSHGARQALHTPELRAWSVEPPPLHPESTDPLMLGWVHFRAFFDFLCQNVRHFKFDFVQVLEDPSDNPLKAAMADPGIETLIGAESLVKLIALHPWRMPLTLSTGTALKLDRLLRPQYWKNPIAALDGRQP